MKADPLAGLHGFYQPEPPHWLPQTLGWYVVLAALVLLAVWIGWRQYRRWRKNRYRRDALRELERIDIGELPELLKRVALAAWPRSSVASLAADSWLRFLESSGSPLGESAEQALARLLFSMNYRSVHLSADEERAARATAATWIEKHHVRA